MKTCPSRNALERFLSGVDEPVDDDLVRHFNECAECQAVAAALDAAEPATAGAASPLARLMQDGAGQSHPSGEPTSGQRDTGRIHETAVVSGRANDGSSNDVGLNDDMRLALYSLYDHRHSSARSIPEEPVPSRIGDYDILRVLGRGGMGTVYLANLPRLSKKFALKIVHRDDGRHDSLYERFEQEMQLLARLPEHPHVVRVVFAGEHEQRPYLVMEYLRGTNLEQLVRTQGTLPVGAACDLIMQAASGLSHIHQHGIVHRDVKPSNLIRSEDGRVRVVDFGLVHLRRMSDDENRLTQTGIAMGSVDFMAPEQAEDASHVDCRADIYSLGCSLGYLLSGRPLHEAGSPTGVLIAHREKDARPLRTVRDDVPPELDAVFRKMVARDAAARYQSMEEVIQALRPFVDPSGPGTQAGSGTAIRPVTAGDVGQKLAAVDSAFEETRMLPRTDESSAGKSARRLRITCGAVFGLLLAGVIIVTVGKNRFSVSEDANANVAVSRGEDGSLQVTITPRGDDDPLFDPSSTTTNETPPAASVIATTKLPAGTAGSDDLILEGVRVRTVAPDSFIQAVIVEDGIENGTSKTLISKTGAVNDIRFVSNREVLIAVGGQVQRWNLSGPADSSDSVEPERIGGGQLTTSMIKSLLPTDDGIGFVAACDDGTVRVCPAGLDSPAIELRHAPISSGATSLTAGGGGWPLYAGFWGHPEGILCRWDSPDAEPVKTAGLDRRVVMDLTLLADGEQLATAGYSGVSLRSAAHPDQAPEWLSGGPENADFIMVSMAMNREKTRLAAGDNKGRLSVWNLQTRELLPDVSRTMARFGFVSAIEFSHDGRWLAVGNQRGVFLIDVETGRSSDVIRTSLPCELVRFSLDDEFLLNACGRLHTHGGDGQIEIRRRDVLAIPAGE